MTVFSDAAAWAVAAVALVSLVVSLRALAVAKKQHSLAVARYQKEQEVRARRQADLVSVRVLPGATDEYAWRIPVVLSNLSDVPVTSLRVIGIFKGPAAPVEDYFDIQTFATHTVCVRKSWFPPWREFDELVSRNFYWRDLEPGSKAIELPVKKWRFLLRTKSESLGIAFVDVNGVNWTRRLDGRLFAGTTLDGVYFL